jgi:anthranilate/para-aminobenzoate synthase component II
VKKIVNVDDHVLHMITIEINTVVHVHPKIVQKKRIKLRKNLSKNINIGMYHQLVLNILLLFNTKLCKVNS